MAERYIHYHTQSPGYQARRIVRRNGEILHDVSRYFGKKKYGSLRAAKLKAVRWRNRNLTTLR